MDIKTYIEADLGIPDQFLRVSSPTRCVCLVDETWLRQAQAGSVPATDRGPWSTLTETECGVLLAPSYATIPRPWVRVSIKVIPKSNKIVESFVEESLSASLGPGLSELLSYVSHANFCGLWESTQQRHSKARLTTAVPRVTTRPREYNDVVRSVLRRLFHTPITNLSNPLVPGETSETKTPIEEHVSRNQHPNLLPAYSIYESDAAFLVVQPYVEFSLHDLVTFSPAVLSATYAKPLFILYQVLHAVKHAHHMGVSAGNLRLRDVLVDNKLWVSLTQPHMKLVCGVRDGKGAPVRLLGEVTRPEEKDDYQQENIVAEQENEDQGLENDAPLEENEVSSEDLRIQEEQKVNCPQETKVLMKEKPENIGPYEDYSYVDLPQVMQQWVHGEITNFDYLMILNHLTGRRMGDPNHHPMLPWVMDFTQPNGGFRDLSRSKFRLNKGDRQLDLTFDTSCPFPNDSLSEQHMQIPHHISDVLSDITYYVYTARTTPKAILCTHVRSKWVPNEYPSSMQRMQEWTPDECIPEFFIDPTIFTSIHDDLPDLELPPWASSAQDFVNKHLAVLEGEHVSQRLHQWVDLNFGYKLSGSAAVKSKNVCLQLVDQHTELVNHGVVQLFHQPHPPRLPRTAWSALCQPRMRHTNVTSPLHPEQPEKREVQDRRQRDANLDPRPEESAILLPKGFDPLASLDQVEAMYNFAMRSAHCSVPERPDQPLGSVHRLKEKVVARDLQALGCLMVELFHSARLRVLSPEAPLVTRYALIRRLCAKVRDELPRPVRYAVNLLLHLKSDWTPQQVDQVTGALFSYDVISKEGLPPPSADLLLQPQASILPFPTYFPSLYAVLARLKALDTSIQEAETATSNQSQATTQEARNLAKEKVSVLMTYISRMGPTLGREGMELLLPYITELLQDLATCVHAAWSLFEPVAQILGPADTAKRLLPRLTALLDGEVLTRKHMKLYHRSFVIQLLVRLGATTFLQHFTTLLIEASAGYKNFSGEDPERQISNDPDTYTANGIAEEDYPSVFVDDGLVLDRVPLPPVTGEKTPEDHQVAEKGVLMAVEALPDDEWLSGELEEARSSSGSAEQVSEDRTDSHSIGSTDQADMFAAETSSVGSVEANEELLGRSVGRLSVHSVSRLLQEELERNAAADASSTDGAEISQQRTSSSDPEDDPGTDSKGEDMGLTAALVRSETEEFTSSILDSGSIDYNISHVAAETIKWLSHRLGPVLTAKWLSRNLLRMLALCYYGDEQLEPIARDVGYTLSTTNKPVAGDYNASQVLDCLSCIAVLYGEHVILLQYFPHCRELIAQAQKKLTGRSEAGLICSAALLNHILAFLSDATLMDILQETIFKDLVLPLLKLVSSVHVSFPGGARARTVICHKLIDGLYIISLRIGFEMTRQNMTFVLQKFFAAFSRVHDDRLDAGRMEDGALSPQPDHPADGVTSPDSVYMELKHDAVTGSYKIVTPPVKPSSWQPSHQRQGSGGFRYSLSPATQEDETDTKGVDSQDHIMAELRQTFTPHLAHLAYIPFCKLAGGIHMEQNLINDDLIRQLCTMYDEAVSQQNAVAAYKASSSAQQTTGCGDGTQPPCPGTPGSDDDNVSGSFGRNVTVAGNKIVIADDEPTGLDPQSAGGSSANRGRRKSGESVIDDNKLRSPEMDFNKQRHLKGNWLAYWEHELGLSEREMNFNFKQIKLQTFSGHTNSIRSLYILDNENSFISASKDKTVKLWSLRSFGDGTGRVGSQWTYTSHKKSVFSVTFLETVRLAASCDSIVHIWDPFMGMAVRQFDSPRNPPVTVVTPMPAPHCTLVTATTDATLRFLDVRAATYMHEFKCSTGPAGLIRCTAVSPDGHWVAAGYSSGIISIIDIRTGLLLATWKGHEGEILQVKAYNNKTILTTSLDQTMTLWNVEDAMAVCHFKGATEPVHCAVFYRNEILSATTANRVGVHTSVDRKACFSSTKLRSDVFRGVLTTMSVLPQNRLLLLGADNGTIRLLA